MSTVCFSVIVPLYNKATLVKRALESVFGQIRPPGEIIVVDDGSTDDSAVVVEGVFADHAKAADGAPGRAELKLIRQKNAGPGAARNAGIRAASGTHIAFMDADDEWLPEHLQAIAGAADALGALEPVGIFVSRWVRDGTIASSAEAPGSEPYTVIRSFCAACGAEYPVCSSGAVVPRMVLDEVGLFNESAIHKEDVDLWVRISLRYPIVRVNRTLVTIHSDDPNRLTRRFMPRQPPIEVESLCRFFNCEIDTIPRVPERRYAQMQVYRYCRGMIRHGKLAEFDRWFPRTRFTLRRRAFLWLLRRLHFLVPKKRAMKSLAVRR